MKKTIAGLVILALTCFGCTTMMNVKGIGGFHSPIQGSGSELGIRIGSSNGVHKDAISVDNDIPSLVTSSQEPSVSDEMLIPETLIIALIVSSILRDLINSGIGQISTNLSVIH